MPLDRKQRIDVMVSSTTTDLGAHRRALSDVITSLLMTPRMMDNDAATGKDGLTYSLDLVDEAEVYILLLGFRYGHVPDDPIRNPHKLGMTHLEYRRAKERAARGETCVFAFLLADELKPEIVKPELVAFREEVLGDQVKFFTSLEDLKLQVMQTLSIAPCIQSLKDNGTEEQAFQPRVGEVLNGRYTFVQRLGQGGNGEVWKARDTLTDGSSLDVAIKLLKPEVSEKPERIKRFQREIALTRRLRHPHIIRTTTDGTVGKQFYAVMDYIEGQTLRDFIAGKRFSVDETVRYLGDVAEALHTAHRQYPPVIHRDVKPENIMVQDDKLYLGDFGLAISPEEDSSVTATGELVGTKKYMAPEQWDNQPISPQTDIYALALIAYEMIAGEYPYDASSHARLLHQHMHEPLPAHPALADEVLAILRRATAKPPAARYQDPIEFITELSHWRENPADLETKVSKYLETLHRDLKGDVYEKLFVDLEGDIRTVIQQVREEQTGESAYHDPMLDEFGDLLADLLVDLDADHHEAQTTEPAQYVEHILDKLVERERVVLVGEPGSGKSFTLRRLVMHYLKGYSQFQRVPVFVPLNAFKGETDFSEYVRAQLKGLAPYYEHLRDSGRLVLICDALNEMPRTAITDERELVPEVRDALQKAPRFVVSCRIRDYQNDLDSLKLERLEVRDLDLPAIREFVRRYRLLLKYDDAELWDKMGGSEGLFTFWEAVRKEQEPERFWQEDAGIPSYTSGDDDWAWWRMWEGAKLIPLARNPYMARVICSLHGKATLPENRAALYQAFVLDLYEREHEHAEKRGQSFPERDTLEVYLTDLANRMQADQTTVLKAESVPQGDLLQAALDATLLTQDGDTLRFSHQLLQEYFAARTMALRMSADEPLVLEQWWQSRLWRETFLMLAEFVDDKARAIRWLGQANPDLAIETWERLFPEAVFDTATQSALIASANAKKTEPNPVGRAAAYRVLGRFDADHRPGIGLREVKVPLPQGEGFGVRALPDIEWVDIPAGKFTMGHKGESDNPPRILTLDYSFQISRYPVTYKQFQAFLDDPKGFSNSDWWEGLAIPAGHNNAPGDQAYKFWNHPRERVSWYDAIAFCRWMSWRLDALTPTSLRDAPSPSGRGAYDPMNSATWAVRLPTEFEWEKAARANTGWRYPYGNDFDAAKGNTSETGLNQTSAVGIFPTGDAPHWSTPIADLSGNVWEWCINPYEDPDGGLKDENMRSNTERGLRGGSWDFDNDSARAVYRYYDSPGNRSSIVGFRVLRLPHL